ncbi:MAG: glycosyltransferase [Leptospirales bacterium]
MEKKTEIAGWDSGAAPIRVLYFIDKLRAGGGTQRYIYEIIKIAPTFGVLPHLCTLEEGGDYLNEIQSSGVDTLSLSLPRINTPKACLKLGNLVRHIKRKKIQVVHTFQTNPNIFGTLAGRLSGAKVITSRRDLGDFGMRGSRRLTLFEEAIINPLAHRIMANSRAVFNAAMKMEGIPRKKLVLIPNGIDTNRFHPDTSAQRKKLLGLPEKSLIFGTVSGLRKVKALDLLLHAFSALRKRYPDVFLVIAGDGPEALPLRDLTHSLGLTESVRFMGLRLDVERILPAFDVFMLSSRSEGFPNAILEAMACGVPVIATSVGGIRELVCPEVTGKLIAPDNMDDMVKAMRWIHDNPEKRREFSENARRHVEEHFRFEVIGERLGSMYRQLACPSG